MVIFGHVLVNYTSFGVCFVVTPITWSVQAYIQDFSRDVALSFIFVFFFSFWTIQFNDDYNFGSLNKGHRHLFLIWDIYLESKLENKGHFQSFFSDYFVCVPVFCVCFLVLVLTSLKSFFRHHSLLLWLWMAMGHSGVNWSLKNCCYWKKWRLSNCFFTIRSKRAV